jgi:methyl-accepting chemotaxis protein
MKEDGTRAVGSTLQGVARDVVLGKGVAYHGDADILGVPYFTAYDPIFDSRGSTIGILYVGVQKAEFMRSLRTTFIIAVVVASAMLVLFTALILVSVGGVMREIVRLTGIAEQISVGAELDQPVVSKRTDELKELALSVERLRKSMKTALERLG